LYSNDDGTQLHNNDDTNNMLRTDVTFARREQMHEPVLSFQKIDVDVSSLSSFFDGKFADMRRKVRQFIENTEWRHEFDVDALDFEEQRKLSLNNAKIIANNVPFDVEDAMKNNSPLYVSFIEELGKMNPNHVAKFTIQFSLFIGCLINLGTERHKHLLKDAKIMKLLGLFAMTEKGHGSNVRGIETTATYDKRTKEFVIHTPNLKAMKSWIGGSGTAHYGAVFAQLIVDGKKHGVHVFLVPFRDQNGNLLPGITLEDCGYKMGLNGLDNMSIAFDHVRISRENLLNRYSDVTDDGRYINNCGSESKHFAMTVGELTGGRIVLSGHSLSICKVALTIAIRYAFARKQFGPPGKPEIAIINYPTHQRRLMPLLARTIALVPFLEYVKEEYGNRNASNLALVHSLTSIIKVTSSWHMLNVLDICRQCCGAAGYRAVNRIATLLRDAHIWTTFEGDNTILTQQVAKYLLSVHSNGVKTGKFSQVLSYANVREELLPISVTNADDKLLNLQYQQHLFQEKEFLMIQELSTNLEGRIKNGENDWESFNSELVLVRNLALAHADRLIHEKFVQYVQNHCSANVDLLILVAQLNALKQIQEDLGWFTAHQVLPPSLARRVEPLVNALSKEVCQYSLDIIKAFQIPEKLLPPADLSNYVLLNNTMFYGK
jgi:acyl-CoA oxidase